MFRFGFQNEFRLRHGNHYNIPVLPLKFQPVALGRSEPFSYPDWLYELKYDGFRSIVHVEL